MAIDWNELQRSRVGDILDEHPLTSGRCEDAARAILPVASDVDTGARIRHLKARPGQGRFVLPRAKLGARWYHHASVQAQHHYVDALTGVDGTPGPRYLEDHWQYPDVLVWHDGELS